MISVAQIVGLAGMNERPEYYSGRGIRTEDLDANKLYHIYEIIKEQISETAANSFAWMVEEIYPLSTTNFLEELYRLEQCEWNIHTFNANITGYIKGRFAEQVRPRN